MRVLNQRVRDYIARLGRVWVAGQITQLQRRSGSLVYFTLRDADAQASVEVVLDTALDRSIRPQLAPGQEVVVYVTCEYWARNGRFVLRATRVQAVGIGALLAALEQRRGALAAEGLFDQARKRPLPLLPRRVGLITGLNAQAKQDVLVNASVRWPGVDFEVREGPVQGDQAVASLIRFLRELDAMAEVDVIVFARGGGSVEDLLPFSDESLIRAVAAARTPVVSAIGHEQDSPLLDHVADLRASTPTDAGRKVVPDMAGELAWLGERRARADRAVGQRLEAAQTWLEQVRRRPVLADPAGWLPRQRQEIDRAMAAADQAIRSRLASQQQWLAARRAHARALSPLATLERGYAVVLGTGGSVVRSPAEAPPGTEVELRLHLGSVLARVERALPSAGGDPDLR